MAEVLAGWVGDDCGGVIGRWSGRVGAERWGWKISVEESEDGPFNG